jgi:uncharacterized membrane protein YkvA (DUF1232 family)
MRDALPTARAVDFASDWLRIGPTMRIPSRLLSRFETHRPEAFSIDGFWSVVRKVARHGGRKLLASALTLFYCLNDAETPAWAKSVIVGALGYLILPLDLIPDAIPGVGFTDDLGVLLGAMVAVVRHIKLEHREKAGALTGRILGAVGLDECPEDTHSDE